MNTIDYIFEKFKLNKEEQSPTYISGDRNVFPSLFRELGFKVGVEVGVLTGIFSEVLCQEMPDAVIHSVDPWEFYPVRKNFRKQKDHDANYIMAVERLSKYPNNNIIRKKSVDAAKDFENESLDFVFIDGDHEFQAITNDIAEWLRKVKKGGIISGHDYGRSHDGVFGNVKDVVLAWTFSKKITPWFVLETEPYMNNRESGAYRETSWFWVKQ